LPRKAGPHGAGDWGAVEVYRDEKTANQWAANWQDLGSKGVGKGAQRAQNGETDCQNETNDSTRGYGKKAAKNADI
jgi:hypothetical protein